MVSYNPNIYAGIDESWIRVGCLWIERIYGCPIYKPQHANTYKLSRYIPCLQELEDLGLLVTANPRHCRYAVVDDYGNLRLVDLQYCEEQWEYREELDERWRLEQIENGELQS